MKVKGANLNVFFKKKNGTNSKCVLYLPSEFTVCQKVSKYRGGLLKVHTEGRLLLLKFLRNEYLTFICGLVDRAPSDVPALEEEGDGCAASVLSGSCLPGEEFPCLGIFKTGVCFAVTEDRILGEVVLRVLCPQG